MRILVRMPPGSFQHVQPGHEESRLERKLLVGLFNVIYSRILRDPQYVVAAGVVDL